MRYRFLRFPEGKGKAVTLSYDDGCPSDIKLACIINKYGMKCTFNMNNTSSLLKEEVRDDVTEHILSKGHEIAVHGALHRAEGMLRPIEGIEDVLSCRKELEKKFNMIIRGMAYPDSGIRSMSDVTSYDSIRRYLKDLDIVYARTLGKDNDGFRLPDDWYAWMPTAHHSNPDMMQYIDRFVNLDMDKEYSARRCPRLFYIWGHSYEFKNNDNWGLLEDICKGLSGKSDVWYATNIEIYNYVNAYNSLSSSADGKIIYNPTLYTIWFDIDGMLYSIKPDETVYLDKE